MGWEEPLRNTLTALSGVTPAQWCQSFFLLAAGAVLAVAVMPRDAKTLLIDYGARKAEKPTAGGPPPFSPTKPEQQRLAAFEDRHYHVLDAGAALLASAYAPSATLGQVALGWGMMFLQGVRRVFEHATIIKPSKSTMWVVHWLLGLFFYLCISVSIWVEGSGALLDTGASHTDHAQSLVKMAVGAAAFLYAWVNQYRTLLCALIFVAVNLGVTASGTRKWYADKFGTGPVANKWNMIPFVF
ncbi:hypothetical protein N0V88_002017 [Collariella sp. IMI 366227]|nr:hypothetical protein N0V88_002017 [Collariella sp. IMI 366227]